ncbi:Uu.00g116330.m01.CDS01 [Anthostomella pinea]|uniref:non-specific serine/threonine protein kinase n=1 Tax=Anthostomella pinea TaxID=933095 RepID=A0AAI8VH30_9PEZI|nr:Uu.00g116330.m01.CDS01 [Anthostomella pinea]
MADRGVSMSHIQRPPLGDATDRVINASSQKPGKRTRALEPETNPLRAHPSGHRPTDSRSSTRAATSTNNNARGPANPRASTISQDDRDGSKRDSQISTSSGASSSKRKTHIGPWQLGKTLGKGSAARVRLARHQATQELVAVKILAKNMTQLTQAGSLAELDKWDRNRDEYASERHMPLSIEREVAILKLIDHPHIVKLNDIWENRSEIYLVLEYMEGGDLFTYINEFGPLREFEMMHYFRQILSALEYVHSFNICHRDLKPENILMKENGEVKIADFGMAAIQQGPTHTLKTSCGSPHYAAPELVSRSRYQGDKVDIWSLGVILYAALCARLPFDDPYGDVPRLLARAARGHYEVPAFISDDARDLIARMLTVEPRNRISIRKIWKHRLIRQYDDGDDLNDGGKSLESRKVGQCQPVLPEDLDMQTLRQLKSMWHTFSEKHLAMKLMTPEPNDQKLFYWLLLNYREKRLENYDGDLTYSASDYHHLRPANWKKKFTTAEFPSKYGRTPSRFTVISNVATEEDSDGVDNATDCGNTIQSYDPYKSSRNMEDVEASHAKIVIHRNASSAKDSTHSSKLRQVRSGSIKSSSTYSKRTRGARHITAPAAYGSTRRSLSSVRSGEGAPYVRPASRHKRGVDFSHVRRRSSTQQQDHMHRAPASIAGDDTTYDRDYMSPASSVRIAKTSRNPSGRSRPGTQSMADMSGAKQGGLLGHEEMSQFGHSIAKDCDEAFNSSLLSPQSYLDEAPFEPSISEDAKTLSVAMATPTPAAPRARGLLHEPRPWDVRPLPPAPPPTDSVLHEIMMAKKRAERRKDDWFEESSKPAKQMAPNVVLHDRRGKSTEKGETNRRVASAPIYSQFSTQWGKDAIPLPPINEGFATDKSRIVSAPVTYSKSRPDPLDEGAGLEYLARHEQTIRVVNSISDRHNPVRAPAPLNIRKQASREVTASAQSRQELNLRQKYVKDEAEAPVSEEASTLSLDRSSAVAKKKASWFKRTSKDNVFDSNGGSASSNTDKLTYTDSSSSRGPAIPPAKKKSFSLAFWKGNTKDQPQMQISLGGSDYDDSPSPEPARMFNHPGRPHHKRKMTEDAATRHIEPQQNWLARLFKVKPATKYLCFSISRRRARQEIAILLKEWRKYGIREVQVDKERNIVFARVAKKNYLNLNEVSFAAEIMTVIEHGKRSQLCIARFTQERGAASSFHKVVDTMNAVFSVRNLLVAEKRRVKMMIKTLNS